MDFNSIYDFNAAYNEKLHRVNNSLAEIMSTKKDCPGFLAEAMKYSLFAGGKRLRPVLVLAANELAGGNGAASMPLACALEMIHTYSLIHDDLPAMDDDDYRRGIPTNHKVFGEATAILAGDGLLNLAYETMLDGCLKNPAGISRYVRAAAIIAAAAGIEGMIGGQAADVASEGKDVEASVLSYIHKNKTGALITAALHAGAALECDDPAVLGAVVKYGKAIGLAFQITDDILDVEGDFENTGKSTGSDERRGKATFPARYGLEGSKKAARELIQQALEALAPFGEKGWFLARLAKSMLDRKK